MAAQETFFPAFVCPCHSIENRRRMRTGAMESIQFCGVELQ